MTAVLKHELKNYFRTMTAYVFGAGLLLAVGLGAMLYNIEAAVSNFEFALSYFSIIFAVIVPILTMRVIAEERKQKTDQLLYSLPITTTQVIVGKYLALLAVYMIPLCIVALYPLIFSQFGDVYLLTVDAIPEDADCVMIYAPASDISPEEKDLLADYAAQGGKLFVAAGPVEDGVLENLYALLADYGVETNEGIVVEGDREHYSFQGPAALLPDMGSDAITDSLIDG